MRERHPVALEVPVGHGEGQGRLEQADEAVGLEDQLSVYQPVFAHCAGLAEEDVCFRGFVGESDGGHGVGE